MRRIWNILLFVVIAPALLIFINYALNNVPRYLSWHNLTLEEVKENALIYSNNQPVCIYVVDCSSGIARLKLIRDEAKLDIDKLKSIFWRRRFKDYCEGYTENIVIDYPNNIPAEKRRCDARWSFYHDRFITNCGRFQGSVGSFYPYDECTESDVLWGVK